MTRPSVSVVIPAYNAERFLEETLASIRAQTRPPGEVIVVDDGSTDATARIAEEAGAPVRVVRKANGGVSTARNLGMDEAEGEYLAFCDADDVWEPGKLETQLEHLERSPGASAAFTGVLAVDEELEPVEPLPAPPPSRVTLADLVHHRRGRIPPAMISAVVVPRDVAARVGRFDESLSDAADWDYTVRLRLAGPFCGPSEHFVRYRVHEEAMSRNVELRAADVRRLFDKFEANEELRRALGPELARARARNAVVTAAGLAATGAWGRAARWLLREGMRHPVGVVGALVTRVGGREEDEGGRSGA